jgi:hypothetical protein
MNGSKLTDTEPTVTQLVAQTTQIKLRKKRSFKKAPSDFFLKQFLKEGHFLLVFYLKFCLVEVHCAGGPCWPGGGCGEV